MFDIISFIKCHVVKAYGKSLQSLQKYHTPSTINKSYVKWLIIKTREITQRKKSLLSILFSVSSIKLTQPSDLKTLSQDVIHYGISTCMITLCKTSGVFVDLSPLNPWHRGDKQAVERPFSRYIHLNVAVIPSRVGILITVTSREKLTR